MSSVPPGRVAVPSTLAVLMLRSVVVLRSLPTTAPFALPNCGTAFTSRLVENSESPTLMPLGGTSLRRSEVVIEISLITVSLSACPRAGSDGAAATARTTSAASLITPRTLLLGPPSVLCCSRDQVHRIEAGARAADRRDRAPAAGAYGLRPLRGDDSRRAGTQERRAAGRLQRHRELQRGL